MSEIQRAFASGEVSPTLYGRADVDRWRSALKKCENWIVEPEGGLTVRQGFKHIDRVQRDANDTNIRLIPFEFGPNDSVVIATYRFGGNTHWSFYSNSAIEPADPTLGADLAFGPLVFNCTVSVVSGTATIVRSVPNRFPYAINDKVIVGLDGQAPTTSYGILTISAASATVLTAATTSLADGTYENCVIRPYQTWAAYPGRQTAITDAFDLNNARFVQSGDRLYFANAGLQYPWQVTRQNLYDATYNRNTQWDIAFTPSTPPAVGSNNVTLTGSAGADTVRYRVTYTDKDGLESSVFRGTAGGTGAVTLSSGRWNVNVTAHGLIDNDFVEVVTAKDNSAGKRVYNAGDVIRVRRVDANNFTVAGDGAVSGTLSVLRVGGSNNTILNPSSTTAVTVSWSAIGGADYYNVYREFGRGYGYIGSTSATSFIDKGIIPDTKDTPSLGNASPWRIISPVYGNIPTAVGIFQQRLLYGGFNLDPERVVGSHTGNYINFEAGAEDSAALDFTLAGKTVSEVKHFVEIAGRSVVLTSTAEWVLRGVGGILTPTAINARVDSFNGSSDVAPVVVSSNLIYLQRGDKIVRDAQYDFAQEALASRDLTLWAKHLFPAGIKRLCYQRTEQIVWALTKNGRLLGLTYIPEQNVWGWHQHVLDGHPIEDICVVSESGVDRLWAVSSDGAYLNILQLPARWDGTTQKVDDHMGFDLHKTYDGTMYAPSGAPLSVTLSGGVNWTTSETLTLTCTTPDLSSTTDTYMLVKGNDVLYVRQTGFTSSTVISVQAETIVPASMRGAACDRILLCANTISGMTHLTGDTVGVIADGGVQPDQVVPFTLPRKFGRIQAGVKVRCTAQTLDIEGDQQDSNLGDIRHVTRLLLWVLNTRGLKAGFDDNSLEEMTAEFDGVSNQAPTTQSGVIDIPMRSSHSGTGSVIIRQDTGLPAQIINARTLFNIGKDR